LNGQVAPADADRPRYRRELDGIRGVAIALVVLSHALQPTRILEGGGFVGVNLFFVLSGFLITSILLDEHRATGRISLRGFYERRVRRLAPALIVFLAVFLAWSVVAGLDRRADILAALFYGSDVVEASGGSMHELGHLWSLAVEEQFYLVWPFALIGLLWLGHRASRAVLVIVAALAAWRLVVFVATLDWARVYFGPDTVAVALVAGAALAMTPAHIRRPRAVGAAGLVVVLVLASTLSHSVAPSATILLLLGIPVAVGASVALLAGAASVPGLSSRPLVWLGGISYALYLWHTTLNGILESVYGWDVGPRLVAIPIAIAIAALSLRFVEKPFRVSRLGSRDQTADGAAAPTTRARRSVRAGSPVAAALPTAPVADVEGV
jgi:peptidoglycan/LPS O-acetylase OafA/YrhL